MNQTVARTALCLLGVLSHAIFGPQSAAVSQTETRAITQAPNVAPQSVRTVSIGALSETASALRKGERFQLSQLPLHDGPLTTLNLERFEIRAPGTGTHVNGPDGSYQLPDSQRIHFLGTVKGSESSWAYLTVASQGRLQGMVRDRGRTFTFRQEGLAARPFASRSEAEASAQPALMVRELGVGQLASGPPAPGPQAPGARELSCGVTAHDQHLAEDVLGFLGKGVPGDLPTAQERTSRGQLQFYIDLALETDFEFYDQFQDVDLANDYVETLFGAVAAIYQVELFTTLRLVDVYLHTAGADADPWEKETSLQDINTEVRFWWNSNRWRFPRTVVHMLTGKNLGGGRANLGVLCHPRSAFSVSRQGGNILDPGDPIMSFEVFLLAHELGHNLGSRHTHEVAGYNPVVDECNLNPPVAPEDGGTLMSYCYRAPGWMANINPSFGEAGKYGFQSERVTNNLLSWLAYSDSQGCLGSPIGIKLFEEKHDTGFLSMWSDVVQNGDE